ncbi:hypothetical protein GBAR_LOCUS9421 [Geodia barretti]|uniref:Uncharacterized protein n=1 Tax=Geodia barretti TaxID=519541 RepID=A0AA35WIL8_GEOBA|nr:hypothetical protein GBAR_LOCUS9421 [Geodia barretti]
MSAQVQLMPRLQEVGTALHPSSADETRAQVPENDVFAADGGQNAEAAATNHLVVQGGGFWSGINGREQSPFRSPSPEYVDAVEYLQYELQHKAMGETVTRGDTNEVEEDSVENAQRLTLTRDPAKYNSSSSDLGIGIRVAGGVGCEKCGELHTVITDVTTTDIPNQYKGLAVMEWCRHGVDGVTHEEMRRIIARTEEETSIQLIVKECRGPSLPKAEDNSSREPLNVDQDVSSQVPNFTTDSPRRSPSSSTDREASYTPKSLSPTPSPIHSRTCTPSHSPSTTPSPTPPPSPNTPRRGPVKKQNLDPRPVSINLPVSREVVVAPKFMINGIPTGPPQEAGQSKKFFTVESFLGSAPAASIHVSYTYLYSL